MSKRTRQYIGILAALAAYYLIHEGAHLLYALFIGVFKQIRLMGLGVQIDVCAERMTDTQLGIFCLVGALATFCVGYLLAVLAKNICRAHSKLLRAVLYQRGKRLAADRCHARNCRTLHDPCSPFLPLGMKHPIQEFSIIFETIKVSVKPNGA